MSRLTPFHVALPVHDLSIAETFYRDLLQCRIGRRSDTWIDFDLYGHQVVTHQVPGYRAPQWTNPVDTHAVPVPHFGVVLEMPEWQRLATRLRDHQVSFVIEPYIRFQGQAGEQATLFLLDPSGNVLEFKAFRDLAQLFAT